MNKPKHKRKYKFFFTSDLHNYYSEFLEALVNAGYDTNDENHILVILGDYFDRGDEAQKILDFLNSHTERIVLVRGNHDVMIQEMIDQGYYQTHNVSNGTVDTFRQLSNLWEGVYPSRGAFENACLTVDEKLTPLYKRMVNYVELKKYIGVHSWIPTKVELDQSRSEFRDLPTMYAPTIEVYNPNWREAHQLEWDEAMWGNPYKLAKQDLNQTGKTIISGHWHCSYGWYMKKLLNAKDETTAFKISSNHIEYEYGKKANFNPYKYKDKNTILIDACTAVSHKVNVFVVEDYFDEEWYNKYSDKIIL